MVMCYNLYLIVVPHMAHVTLVSHSQKYGQLTSVPSSHHCVGLPLCWNAFSENTAPHKQHWTNSVQLHLSPLCPSWDWTAHCLCCALCRTRQHFTPLWWTFAALRCRDLTGSSLAKSFFTVFWLVIISLAGGGVNCRCIVLWCYDMSWKWPVVCFSLVYVLVIPLSSVVSTNIYISRRSSEAKPLAIAIPLQ